MNCWYSYSYISTWSSSSTSLSSSGIQLRDKWQLARNTQWPYMNMDSKEVRYTNMYWHLWHHSLSSSWLLVPVLDPKITSEICSSYYSGLLIVAVQLWGPTKQIIPTHTLSVWFNTLLHIQYQCIHTVVTDTQICLPLLVTTQRWVGYGK